MRSRLWLLPGWAVGFLAVVGCDPAPAPSEKPAATMTVSSSQSAASASAPATPASPAIAKPSPPVASALPLGPDGALVTRPPRGVFAGADADAILKKGEPRRVTLVTAGAEPRERLSYRVAPGDKQTVTLALDLAMAMNPTGAQPKLTKMPRTETTLEIVAEAPDADGAWPVEATVVDVVLTSSDPAQSKSIGAARDLVGKIRGAKLKTKVSPRGGHGAFTVEGAEKRAELAQTFVQLQQSIENFITPLPDAAVGVGARWAIVERLSSTTDILQVRQVTLKRRDGKSVELDVAIEQLAANDQLASAGGQSAKVTSLESSGKASFVLDLERVAPEAGASDVTTVMFLQSGRDGLRTEAAARATIKSR